MEPETGTFNQLQLSKSRSRSGIWRPDNDGTSTRRSVVSVADSRKSRRSVDSTRSDRNASSTSVSIKGQEIRRWDGENRSTTHWDDLKRDPELWFPDGNVLVHFYARGTSRKGPSLRLHRRDIEDSGCRSILSKFCSNALMEEEEDENSSSEEDEDGGFQTNPKTRGKDELYIPAPSFLSREEALKFHLTTRNLFACLHDKPMVGNHLGESLVLMHERLNQYRPDKERNRDDMLDYVEDQRYTEFKDCPDHAMAIMYYAEKLRDTDLWTEAFVHCVGMYDILNTAIEFPTVSRTIGALITRAHLEMTLRMEHAYADLGNFMEDSISSAFPKLPEPVAKHLERFRSFLHAFYVQQHGYWPPPSLQPGSDYNLVTKSLLRSIYVDLRNLYSFLCDGKSEPNPTQAQIETYKAIYGGICTPALIAAFDRRFKNTPLPNPLPLLPVSGTSGKVSPITSATNLAAMDLSSSTKPTSGNAFTRFLRPKKHKSVKALNALNMLSAATNTNDQNVMNSLLVQEYSRFERDWTVRGEEKIDSTEARKARWLLIYALLQTIISIVMVPQEVAGTADCEYPLCVQTGGTPPWKKRPKTKAVFDGAATPQLEALSTATSPAASPYLTPTTPGGRSGNMTPISGIGDIPPVPQLVLAELEKLQRRSFDSGRETPNSPDDRSSIRSGKLTKKPKLKSSSASIRSERSTRSSFGAMLNRSLYMGPGYAESSASLASDTSHTTAKPEPSPKRPAMAKQKSAPAQIEHELGATRSSRRSSIFGKMRSRNSSVTRENERDNSRESAREASREPAREAPRESARLASPEARSPLSAAPMLPEISLDSSSWRQVDNRDSTISVPTSEYPLSPSTVRSFQSALETPQTVQSASTRGQVIPMIDTSATEPDRGRALHAPHSPSALTPTGKKVRNFSRGRSSERARSSHVASPAEVPPPVPTTTKPKSAASSPARSVHSVRSPDEAPRMYTDARSPPPVPISAKPTAAPIDAPPTPNNATKPRSRPASPSRPTAAEAAFEALPMPPPIPFSSKPNSRANSPAPSFRAKASSPLHQLQPKLLAQQLSQVQYEDEPRGRLHPSENYKQNGGSEHRSRSRSLALRPAPPAQLRPPMPSSYNERPVSDVSLDSDSYKAPRSGSISPVSVEEQRPSPDTSAEMLQRKTTNGVGRNASGYIVQQSQPLQTQGRQQHPQRSAEPPEVSHAVTTPDDTAHAAWNRPQQGSFQQVLKEHEQKRSSGPRSGRRGSSRESKYRRAAWAELGSGHFNEANGMPIPPPAVRQYGAPIVRDAPARGYAYYDDDASQNGLSGDESDGGYAGGVSSYGVRKGLMG